MFIDPRKEKTDFKVTLCKSIVGWVGEFWHRRVITILHFFHEYYDHRKVNTETNLPPYSETYQFP